MNKQQLRKELLEPIYDRLTNIRDAVDVHKKGGKSEVIRNQLKELKKTRKLLKSAIILLEEIDSSSE